MVCFLLLIVAGDGRREISSVCLDCDCVVALWAHDFWSDGEIFGRGRCVCDVQATVIANRDFVNVFVDVSGCVRGCVLRHQSSLLGVVSSDLWTYVVSPACSHHPSRANSVFLAQTRLPSTSPLALRLSAVSSCHHRHRGSRHLLCFFSHRHSGL